ncbi:unnamed protein product [Strongylus vulgaris]|uniref:Reverse transcriptase domain-containing protein n=1 Tax=Strongylus vulgaris TaxID=40348 RepID=A0A3P7J382_STRVU|nr:unnamed protein product [Strongylus vulgaris]
MSSTTSSSTAIPPADPVKGPVPLITAEEVRLATARQRTARLLDLFNQVIKAKSMSHDWSNSTTIPIWENKGDIADCSTYRPIRLMSHTQKIFERVLERRLRAIIESPSNQCGFVKCREKRRELHAAFLDMEKSTRYLMMSYGGHCASTWFQKYTSHG